MAETYIRSKCPKYKIITTRAWKQLFFTWDHYSSHWHGPATKFCKNIKFQYRIRQRVDSYVNDPLRGLSLSGSLGCVPSMTSIRLSNLNDSHRRLPICSQRISSQLATRHRRTISLKLIARVSIKRRVWRNEEWSTMAIRLTCRVFILNWLQTARSDTRPDAESCQADV